MKRYWRARPNGKTVVISLVACVGVMTLITQTSSHPSYAGVWYGLVLAGLFLLMVTLRKADPDQYEAVHNPQAYQYHQQCNKLVARMTTLVEAVESDLGLGVADRVVLEAAAARRLLDEVTGRSKPTASHG